MGLTMMERVGDRWEKMEGSCSTGQSPQWAVVPVEEEEEEEEEKEEEEEEEEDEEEEEEEEYFCLQ
jgi:ribosomal protein L12E/L44/L45/RPP1/RPP2